MFVENIIKACSELNSGLNFVQEWNILLKGKLFFNFLISFYVQGPVGYPHLQDKTDKMHFNMLLITITESDIESWTPNITVDI